MFFGVQKTHLERVKVFKSVIKLIAKCENKYILSYFREVQTSLISLPKSLCIQLIF